MRLITKQDGAQTSSILQITLLCLGLFVFSTTSFSQTNSVALVGNKVPTLIDNDDNAARAFDIVKKALDNYNLTLVATTQAWSGSGLKNGTYAGYVDHYSLNDKNNNYIYSEPYLTLALHIASRDEKAEKVVRLDKIYRTSLGIENRFANTDELRSERTVRWARSPDFLGNIKQLADRRVDFIIADKYMLEEFNKMLVADNSDPLYLSSQAIYEVEMRLAIRSDTPNASKIIQDFNAALVNIEAIPANKTSNSLLDEALYEEVIRKW